jgi:hypothetical protein
MTNVCKNWCNACPWNKGFIFRYEGLKSRDLRAAFWHVLLLLELPLYPLSLSLSLSHNNNGFRASSTTTTTTLHHPSTFLFNGIIICIFNYSLQIPLKHTLFFTLFHGFSFQHSSILVPCRIPFPPMLRHWTQKWPKPRKTFPPFFQRVSSKFSLSFFMARCNSSL